MIIFILERSCEYPRLYPIGRETLRPSAEGLRVEMPSTLLSGRIKSHQSKKRRFDMSEWYQVKVKVISQKGTCSAGHKVGDEFIVGDTVPAGMCS